MAMHYLLTDLLREDELRVVRYVAQSAEAQHTFTQM